jgi:hypothetical protein
MSTVNSRTVSQYHLHFFLPHLVAEFMGGNPPTAALEP